MPPSIRKSQLLNKFPEILHKFVSLIFFPKYTVLKAASYSKPISNFKHLQQMSFFRSSCSQMFLKTGVPQNFGKLLRTLIFTENNSVGCLWGQIFRTVATSEVARNISWIFLWKCVSYAPLTCYLLILFMRAQNL